MKRIGMILFLAAILTSCGSSNPPTSFLTTGQQSSLKYAEFLSWVDKDGTLVGYIELAVMTNGMCRYTRVEFNGTLTGNQVILNVAGTTQPFYGTFDGHTLTLQILQPGGGIRQEVWQPASTDDWNNALKTLAQGQTCIESQ